MNAARSTRMGPFKVVMAGVSLAVALTVLLLTLAAVGKPAEAAFPGDNGRITFSRFDGNDLEIFTINPDGTGVTQLTNNTTDDTAPAFAPDGTKIAYQGRPDGNDWEIFTIPASGGTPTQLTNNVSPIDDTDPDWAPDGKTIAYSSYAPDGAGYAWETFTIPSTGGPPIMLTSIYDNYDISDTSPTFSPDGTKIAFVRSYRYGASLVTMPSMGGQPTSITGVDGENAYLDDPDWSPDGTNIAFSSLKVGNTIPECEGRPVVEIFAVPFALPPAVGAWTQLTSDGSYDRWPTFSPDGTKLAYAKCGGIYTAASTGGTPTFVTLGITPDWGATTAIEGPTSKTQCKNGGYRDFGFKNKGQCLAAVR